MGSHTLSYSHGAPGSAFEAVVLITLAVATLGYGYSLWTARRRTAWPGHRPGCWAAGVLCVGAGLVGPLAEAARGSFTAHMLGHLLVGMLGPLLLVVAAPVTALLRALPAARARRLSGLLRNPWVRAATHPVVTGVLNAGGMWLLYTTDLYGWMHRSELVHAVVHTHILVAGYLFTASVVGVDPDPHRTSIHLRSTVLVVFVASHSILAKWLSAHPPAGVDVPDARLGAQVMYYGGDAVDVTLIVLLAAGWYTATRPRGQFAPPPGSNPAQVRTGRRG